MVVIAIVAILAAVAVPVYQNYIISARINTLIPVVDNIIQRSIEFSQKHGRFGNAYDLGLSTTPGSTVIDNPAALSTYFGGSALTSNFGRPRIGDASSNSACWGARGSFMGVLDPQLLGFSPSIVDVADNVGFECDFWHYENTIYRVCLYVYGTTEDSQTDNLIPGWINMNTTSDWDCANIVTFVYGVDSYINAECQ